MPPFRLASLLAAFLSAAGASFVQATDAGKLLPGDTKVIVTINLRQALFDHRNTVFVQRYLDQYRLALTGNEQLLKTYYRRQELHESEGISEREFLARCGTIKSVCAGLGVDPLEDVEQITYGYNGGSAGQGKEAGFFVVILEGRFKKDKFKGAIQQLGAEYFGSCNVSGAGAVWQAPARPDGICVSLLNDRTVVITDGMKIMEAVRTQAAGKAGLAQGMRTLLDKARKDHVGIVLADADSLLDQLARFLKDDVAKSVGNKEIVGKFIVAQGADGIQKFAKDIAAAGLGLSVREDDLGLQIGVDTRNPATARELQTLLQNGAFWAGLALKAINNDTAQQLANIVLRQRIVLKETNLTTQVEVPYDFVKQATKGPWLALLSRDFAPPGPADPLAALNAAAKDAVATRITSIRVWNVPARAQTLPLPPGSSFARG